MAAALVPTTAAEQFTLRPYQREAIDAITQAWARGINRPAVQLSTGLGKTVIFSRLIAEHLAEHGGRAVVLVHREELATQAADKLARTAPNLAVGIVKAERDDTHADVVICSVPTLARQDRRERITDVSLVVADECFPARTMVGHVAIEHLKIGDLVPSYDERTGRLVQRAVTHKWKRRPTGIVRILIDGRAPLVCTPNHPILTPAGWIPAGELATGQEIAHADDTTTSSLHGMREGRTAHNQGEEGLAATERAHVLLTHVPGHMGQPGALATDGGNQPQVRIGPNEGQQPDEIPGKPGENVRHAAADRPQASEALREWARPDSAPEDARDRAGLGDGGGHPNRAAAGGRVSVLVQGGHRARRPQDRRGGRRGVARPTDPASRGREEGCAVAWARVAGVEVHQPGSDGTFGGLCPDGYVYNLEVADTHTYVADGVIVHNCHHSAARTWRDAIEHFGCFDATPAAGFSATLQRGDNLSLGDIWQEVVYERGLLWAIRNGYLTDVRGIRVGLDMDLTKVQTRGGDYTEAGLEQAMHAAGAADVIARGYAVHAAGRKGISFAPSVAMAGEIGDALNFAGIRTETITGATTSQERAAIYRRFERGETQVLSSVMVLTEGFDEPSAEVAIMARPTKSQSLYTQMAGRVLRLHPGKESALLLDVCGVSEDHDLSACLPDLAGKEGGGRRLEPRDGESLLEATERQEREPVAPPQPLRSREIDLFAGRGRIWLETAGGVPFLPAGKNEAGRDQYAAVNPAIGGYVVDLITRGRQQALSTHDNSQDAIRAAERFAAEQDGPPNLKSSAWRQRPASSKHLAFTRRLGVPLPDGVTAGQCSDAVAVILASKLIDRVAPAADRQAS